MGHPSTAHLEEGEIKKSSVFQRDPKEHPPPPELALDPVSAFSFHMKAQE
jgi:hypothetical protein